MRTRTLTIFILLTLGPFGISSTVYGHICEFEVCRVDKQTGWESRVEIEYKDYYMNPYGIAGVVLACDEECRVDGGETCNALYSCMRSGREGKSGEYVWGCHKCDPVDPHTPENESRVIEAWKNCKQLHLDPGHCNI